MKTYWLLKEIDNKQKTKNNETEFNWKLYKILFTENSKDSFMVNSERLNNDLEWTFFVAVIEKIRWNMYEILSIGSVA